MLGHQRRDERPERSWVRRPRLENLDERTEERARLGRDGGRGFTGSGSSVRSVGFGRSLSSWRVEEGWLRDEGLGCRRHRLGIRVGSRTTGSAGCSFGTRDGGQRDFTPTCGCEKIFPCGRRAERSKSSEKGEGGEEDGRKRRKERTFKDLVGSALQLFSCSYRVLD